MPRLVKASFSLLLFLTTIISVNALPNVEVNAAKEQNEIVTHGIEDAPIF